MFTPMKHVVTSAAWLVLFAIATPTFAQAPTDAQKSAIRSACRADYEAHCASVTPGGMEALQCLQKNMSSLSSGCQGAVRAIEPAAAPKAEAPPKAEPAQSVPAKTEAAPAAKPAAAKSGGSKPSSTQVAAIKSACRADYPKVCAGVSPGGAAALECLDKNKAKVSPACAKAVSAASGGEAAAPQTAAAGTHHPVVVDA
ncbi:cysteine rich repeat-containing protein, partial [Bradyrhizobium sp.]|uniref:cysteine rich repeat-containing protein n=1 Tax=Bradyrhizobium sp. TaxID=376 RepID=UPI0039E37DA4